jgi:hypothetical protein
MVCHEAIARREARRNKELLKEAILFLYELDVVWPYEGVDVLI